MIFGYWRVFFAIPMLERPNLQPTAPASNFVLDCRGRLLDCRPGVSHGAHVMGVLNVTPDSFSDGGHYTSVDAALRRAETMLEEGAAILDIGGESSRPRGATYGAGAEALTADVEKARVLPVIAAIVDRFPEALLSIDTYKPDVARAALEAGVHIVNDITGLRYFPETAEVAATFGAPLIVMHALGRPGEMPHEHHYDDVVEAVYTAASASVSWATAAGVRHIVTDPGFGFGKTPAENLRLLNHVDRLVTLGHPVLIGVSRKSTIGTMLHTPKRPVPPPAERLFGSLGATAIGVLRGATLVRAHDVRATRDMLHLLAATAAA